MMEKQKVIIIGAGPAGLTAAYELLKDKQKYEVIILEELNQVGGISKTIKYKDNRMDIGGHRFFSKDENVMDFWKELLPLQGEKDPEKEDNVMLIRNRVSRIYYLRKFFDYPITLKWETLKNMGFLKTLKAGLSYIKSLIFKKKEDSLENFYINRFGKTLYGMFFEKYTEKVWGRHPSIISAEWGEQRVKGLSIIGVIKDMFNKVLGRKNKENTETSLIEKFWYPKYGPGQLWEILEKKINEMGGIVKKGHSVKKIEISGNKIKSVTCEVDGNMIKIDGDIFISSMPIKDLICGFDGDDVPAEMLNIAKGLPYRDFITVGLLIDKLNITSHDCWIYVQEADVKIGRIQVFNNWSPYLTKDPKNTVWIGLEYFCNENDKYWNMSDEEFVEFAIDELIKIGIIDSKERVIDSHREKVKKAYPAYFDTYYQIDKLIEYLNKFDNLYCVGRNGQHRYNNMDHSMVTSFETVKNIKNGIKDKSNIWSVNTEKEYHEERKKK
ncbi:MAG: NAD(P)/FAD-dependent oxidoreductase [Clostridia bacterium]|nr:NAD(P)/FAD-dependent oxidoreductase [Clostridia bacterium]